MSKLNKIAMQKIMAQNGNGLSVKLESVQKRLQRMVLAHMLWEDTFYMDGTSNADLVKQLVAQNDPKFVQALAIAARNEYNLRHVPLLLVRELARYNRLTADVLDAVIQRPDELGEFLAIYWQDGKSPISNQVKKGLAKAFLKFNEYQMAKWDKNSAQIRIRDVMFLCRPKPTTLAQQQLFTAIANDTMKVPDTWETQLSSGADKRETFTRLMREGKLGALAFLRNLRNMVESGVSTLEIERYAQKVDTSKVLPFRYIAAARIVPQFKDMLGRMMLKSLADMPKLRGKTILLVDVSGSMDSKISAKSDLTARDAANALAILCRGICESVEIFSFSERAVKVSNTVNGFDLANAIDRSQMHGGTDLARSMSEVNSVVGAYDRVIVFTDEQSSTRPQAPKNGAKGYIVNVATNRYGLNHGAYVAIDGFSEAIISYIQAYESAE